MCIVYWPTLDTVFLNFLFPWCFMEIFTVELSLWGFFCFMGKKRLILCPILSFPLINKPLIVGKNSSGSHWEALHSSPSKFRGDQLGPRSLTVFIWIIDAQVPGLLSLWLMACVSASFSSAAIPPRFLAPFLACFLQTLGVIFMPKQSKCLFFFSTHSCDALITIGCLEMTSLPC